MRNEQILGKSSLGETIILLCAEFIKIMLAGGMNYSRRYTCKHSRKVNI